ncbi:MAG: hypothetical protein WCE80_02980 [Acidimicrobiia bacterium]
MLIVTPESVFHGAASIEALAQSDLHPATPMPGGVTLSPALTVIPPEMGHR